MSEKPPSLESKESAPITHESVLADIRSRFSNSRELYNHVKEMVDKNFAMRMAEPTTSREAADAVLQRLASIRRGGMKSFMSGMSDEDTTVEDAERSFKAGALLGMLTSSVYHGEATFISKDGKVLSEAQEA